jgi:hypothetical protein
VTAKEVYAHSQVGWGLSVLGVMGVEVALIHVLLLGNAGDEEPECGDNEDSLPHS